MKNARNIPLSYSPFGSEMRARTSGTQYRYGFNGKEKDDEVFNLPSSSYDFGARMYDSRLGRWSSSEPLSSQYPSLSPYCFVANSPMFLTDPDGRIIKIYYKDSKGKTKSVIYKIDEEYTGDNKFLRDVYASIEYIQKSDIGKQLVENLVNNKQTLNIVSFNTKLKEDKALADFAFQAEEDFYPSVGLNLTNTVAYNPQSALLTKFGTQTPAVGLLHEFGHAFLAFNKPFLANLLYSIPSRKYGQLEDKYVITKFENPALLQLGEKGIRFSHSKDVQPYKSEGPTESKPTNYDTRPLTNEEKGNNSG